MNVWRKLDFDQWNMRSLHSFSFGFYWGVFTILWTLSRKDMSFLNNSNAQQSHVCISSNKLSYSRIELTVKPRWAGNWPLLYSLSLYIYVSNAQTQSIPRKNDGYFSNNVIFGSWNSTKVLIMSVWKGSINFNLTSISRYMFDWKYPSFLRRLLCIWATDMQYTRHTSSGTTFLNIFFLSSIHDRQAARIFFREIWNS